MEIRQTIHFQAAKKWASRNRDLEKTLEHVLKTYPRAYVYGRGGFYAIKLNALDVFNSFLAA